MTQDIYLLATRSQNCTLGIHPGLDCSERGGNLPLPQFFCHLHGPPMQGALSVAALTRTTLV